MKMVCLVSPKAIAREGLSRIVASHGFEVTTAVATVEDIDWSEEHSGQLTLLDLVAPSEQISALEYVLGLQADVRAMILAETFDPEAMVRCFRSGAYGYIVKDMPSSPLAACLHLAALGEKVMPSEFADLLQKQMPPSPEFPASGRPLDEANLSQREFDVLCCLMAGHPNKVIARELDISEATIKVHVKAILRKLKVVNRTQAAIWAAARGVQSGQWHVS